MRCTKRQSIMTNSTTSHSIRCGFCANLGLPERVVTTHLVRDCKKLANTKCLQCGELGHTVGRCPLNKDTKPKYSRKPFVMRGRARNPSLKLIPMIQDSRKRGAASANQHNMWWFQYQSQDSHQFWW